MIAAILVRTSQTSGITKALYSKLFSTVDESTFSALVTVCVGLSQNKLQCVCVCSW